MKRIIPFIAVAVAMVVPVTISAQTFDYYGYENSDKTILMEWVEDAINAGNIDFDTQAHEDAFLALVDDLYSARDRENWSSCVVIADGLEIATQYIEDQTKRVLVEDCAQITADAYSNTADIVMAVFVPTEIQEQLNDQNPTLGHFIIYFKHFNKEGDEKMPDGSTKHVEKCEWKFEVYY